MESKSSAPFRQCKIPYSLCVSIRAHPRISSLILPAYLPGDRNSCANARQFPLKMHGFLERNLTQRRRERKENHKAENSWRPLRLGVRFRSLCSRVVHSSRLASIGGWFPASGFIRGYARIPLSYRTPACLQGCQDSSANAREF